MNDRRGEKNVFSQQIRERVSVSHESVFQNAFFSQLETAYCTALLLFAFWDFLFDRLGVQSGFSDNATGTSFAVFCPRARGLAGRRADEGGRASREAVSEERTVRSEGCGWGGVDGAAVSMISFIFHSA